MKNDLPIRISVVTAVYKDYFASYNFQQSEIKTMTKIKIFSLYGQFILEQKIRATTIIINKPWTGLKKYKMLIVYKIKL